MADDVTMASTQVQPAKRPIPVPLQSPFAIGGLYGGIAAAAFGGPIGLLAGLASGIYAQRLKKNYLDREVADLENLRAEHSGIQNEIDSEMRIADPEEKRILSHAARLANEGWFRLASGDEAGRAMIDRANELSLSIMTADRDARKQDEMAAAGVQRQLVSAAATDYRAQYTQNISLAEEMDKQAQRVFALTQDPAFDPNKPFNKAVLAEILSTGIGGMYRDAPDVLDAVSQGASSLGGIIGALAGPAGAAVGQGVGGMVGAITTQVKSKDFIISREEYNRIALNIRTFAQQLASTRMERLAKQSEALNAFAQRIGVVPKDYSIMDYVSGGIAELKLTPLPRMPAVQESQAAADRAHELSSEKLPPSEQFMGPVNRQLRSLEQWMNRRKQRPTN